MSIIRGFVGRIYQLVRAKISARWTRPTSGIIKPPARFRLPFPKSRPSSSSYTPFNRFFRSVLRTQPIRSFTTGYWLKGAIGQRGIATAGVSFVGFHDTRVDNVFDRIRCYFQNETNLYDYTRYPSTLNGYDIGSFIAKGCNAVVYEARVKPPQVSGTFASTTKIANSLAPTVDRNDRSLFDAQRQFPLAIKMMFNYDTMSNEDLIVREMGGELVPCTDSKIKPFLKWHNAMTERHGNIVKIITAFVDMVPNLPDARRLFPAALPPSMCDEGVGRNKTLFLVMKRYTMTLRQYLLLHDVSIRIGQILFGQLLEALAYLDDCKISHRDLKSDNILVDFDEDEEPPSLVLADFGCCMSRDTFKMAYPHPDIDLGGNVALRAPEIVRTNFGDWIVLDYAKADLWAAGTLALEIFTKDNPFYTNTTLNETYKEEDLPILNDPVPFSIIKLVKKLLKINPSERPTPINAANVSALSLFGINYLQELLLRVGLRVDFGGKKWTQFRLSLADAINLYTVETLFGRLPESNRKIGHVESALRSAFLSRVDATVLIDAIQYFEQD